ncbi:hypothetical protein QV08_01725 [Gallibacterium salpingitidis]|uniref:Cell-division protein ZapC C-terminal domain-containing protein n=1 Tax=Gallibacterium salpingitidis TaxID=505341 RepID=A0A1A7Q0J8_9PAST|nr:cell division protein ZapC domain-containing protein [Gallibacterium salpingitidis]OBW95701.1 hypothetical protein QS62_02565 [Gallibacterium salpingitidis]OBX07566.1 hypothetical protein QV09_10805 [Gallibacterium salpingitidis]OBX09438.1 hypothetical protein QV08_01725 [Gallibacterium salpingitidis]
MSFNNMCKWQYDAVRDRLTALLPNYTIVETTLSKQVLNGDGLTTSNFALADLDKVAQFLDILEPLQFPEEINQRLAYSAIACEHFLLPKQPQNWFFTLLEGKQTVAEPSLARCFVNATQSWATLLVAYLEGNIANVIVLEQQLALPQTTLYFGDPFRINLNRLEPLMIEVEAPAMMFKQYA